jgi:Tfp pilus assembly protein PilF
MGLLLLPDPTALSFLETATGLEGNDQANAASILSIAQIPGYQPRDMALHLVQMALWGFAERLFTLQIEQDNLDAFSFAYRGYVRDQQGKDGLSDIEMALALDPGLALGYYMLGLHERQAENLDASLNAFLEATLLDPDNPALAAELATAYRLNSALPLAEEWYIKAANLVPEDQRFIGLLAAFYADNGYKLDGVGMEFLQQAAEQYPENPDILTSLGAAQLVVEDVQGAEDSLQSAFLLAPRNPRVRYFMGQLMVAQRNRVEAISHFFFVTQTENPYTTAAQEAIEQLSR